ncbi:MAG: hypothetical protein ACUVR3_11310, partial [Candidatus Roseilinea sp.]
MDQVRRANQAWRPVAIDDTRAKTSRAIERIGQELIAGGVQTHSSGLRRLMHRFYSLVVTSSGTTCHKCLLSYPKPNDSTRGLMDLDALKDKLGEELHGELVQYITEIKAKADKQQKTLRAKLAELEQANADLKRTQEDMLERLGVNTIDELKETAPKGQIEARLKRLEKELADKQAALNDLTNRYRNAMQDAAIRKALAGHEWADGAQDLVIDHLARRVVWDGDQISYKAEDGALLSLDEAMQTLIKQKPILLKSTTAGGSGYRGKPGFGATEGQPNPWAKETFNLTRQIELMRD